MISSENDAYSTSFSLIVRITLGTAAVKCESRGVIIFGSTTVAAQVRRTFSLVRKPYHHCSSSFEHRTKQSRLRRTVFCNNVFFFCTCGVGERRTQVGRLHGMINLKKTYTLAFIVYTCTVLPSSQERSFDVLLVNCPCVIPSYVSSQKRDQTNEPGDSYWLGFSGENCTRATCWPTGPCLLVKHLVLRVSNHVSFTHIYGYFLLV